MVNSVGKFGPYDQMAPAHVPGGRPTRLRTPLRVQTGAELVRSRIALQVRLALLTSGRRLPDAGVLAEELGLSEITVRRALETMCQDGLLDRRRGRAGGTFVGQEWETVAAAFRDPDQAAALADFHLLLECGLVAHRAGDAGPEDYAPLHALVRDMAEVDDPAELLRLETRFHLALAAELGDDAVHEQVADLLGRISLLAPPPEVPLVREQNRHHAELLAALDAGHLEAAVNALKAHHRAACAPA